MTLELPESVFRYLTDPGIRAGVDVLADNGLKKVPAGLTWSEVPQFYSALLAATTVQVEWAVALERLWQEVWPDALGGWTALQPDEQMTEYADFDVSVRGCWNEEWFGRCFTKRGDDAGQLSRRSSKAGEALLCLGVRLSVAGVSIGYSHESRAETQELRIDGFHFDPDEEGWWTDPQRVESRTSDLGPLKEAAARLISVLAAA